MKMYEMKIEGKIYRLGEDDGFIVYEGIVLERDVFYIVCPYGIGDTLYVASLAESLKKFRSINKICLIVKKAHSQIPDWFDAVDEKIVSDEIVNILNVFSIYSGIWEYKNYLYGHFHKNRDCTILPEYDLCEIKNMIYRYKTLVFQLPPECPLEEPKIVPDEMLLEKLMTEYDIGEHSIILMPYANSAKTALKGDHFWKVLASFLTGLGFTVFTNVKDAEELPIQGTIGLCADIATTAALCENCRLVISLRSGICDVLAFTETNLVVLNLSEYHLNEWNLKAAVDRENIHSYIINEENMIPSILEILNCNYTQSGNGG